MRTDFAAGSGSIEQYNKFKSDNFSVFDGHLRLPPEAFPPDLYLKPYPEDEDRLDERLLLRLRTAQIVSRKR